MEIKIVAFNDAEVYAGIGTVDDYYIISLNENKEIEIGDVLSGIFDSSEDLNKDINNITKNYKVNIYLESWQCSLNAAIDHLLHLGSPKRVYAATKDFAADSDNVISNLRREISGS